MDKKRERGKKKINKNKIAKGTQREKEVGSDRKRVSHKKKYKHKETEREKQRGNALGIKLNARESWF